MQKNVSCYICLYNSFGEMKTTNDDPRWNNMNSKQNIQVIMAQWLARRLPTGEVPGAISGKGDNYQF